jgi:hypothetical protein
VASGCGGGTPTDTGPLSPGTRISARTYLADASAAADAAQDFAAALDRAGPTLHPATLKAAAPALEAALARAERSGERLAAARLDDRRLETQRQRAVPSLQRLVDAMRGVTTAARAGDPRAAVAAARRMAAALAALRRVGPTA